VTETVTVDAALAKDLLSDALDADAAASAGPAADPPPLASYLNEDGSPRWGLKADGTPRRAKPGSGRPPKDDRARTTKELPPGVSPARQSSRGTPGRDYSDDIGAALTMAWMGMASIPYTRGHAAIIRAHTPGMIPAWNTAAQQSPAIRSAIEKMSGEGSLSWVIPVTIVTTPVVIGMWQVTRNAEMRAELAARTEQDFAAFIAEQARAAGIEPEAEAPEEETPDGSGD
jgi:hypothetical protein